MKDVARVATVNSLCELTVDSSSRKAHDQKKPDRGYHLRPRLFSCAPAGRWGVRSAAILAAKAGWKCPPPDYIGTSSGGRYMLTVNPSLPSTARVFLWCAMLARCSVRTA